jgi:hypothetical protein
MYSVNPWTNEIKFEEFETVCLISTENEDWNCLEKIELTGALKLCTTIALTR